MRNDARAGVLERAATRDVIEMVMAVNQIPDRLVGDLLDLCQVRCPSGRPPMLAHAFLIAALMQQPAPSPSAEALFDAARRGDRARVEQVLDAGIDVNARARYDVTALAFAANNGHLDVVRLLVERGADMHVQDTFYKGLAIDLALGNGYLDVVQYLLEKGSRGAGMALGEGVRQKHRGLVRAAIASAGLDADTLAAAVGQAEKAGDAAILEMVRAAAAAKPATKTPTVTVSTAILQSHAGI